MAKLIEELIVIKLSRMVRSNDTSTDVIETAQRKLIEETIPTLVEEVLNDSSVVIEVTDIDWVLVQGVN